MRIQISHTTDYKFEPPAAGVIQTLRLTPRNHDGQYVLDWHLDLSVDCRLDRTEDAFGNIIHSFATDGPLDHLTVRVEGEVDTRDTSGVVIGAVERFPPALFLRETHLTRPDEAIAAYAHQVQTQSDGIGLPFLHDLMRRIHEDMTFETDRTQSNTTAAEAFAHKHGVCQDLTHIFISAARCVGIPTRYVGGYLHRADGIVDQEAGHAWAEAYVPDLGWVAFDPTNDICATDAYVRVAVGLDYLGAAPVRGTRRGSGTEILSVAVRVGQAQHQIQS
jgi:transglutaminase-like putative cysteine protease